MEYSFKKNEKVLFRTKRIIQGDNISVILFKPDCFYKTMNSSVLYDVIRPIFDFYIAKYSMKISIEAWINTSKKDVVLSYINLHYLDLIYKYKKENEWLNDGLNYMQNADKQYQFPIVFIFLVGNPPSEKCIKEFVDYFFRENQKLSFHDSVKVFSSTNYLDILNKIKRTYISKKDNLMHASDNNFEGFRELEAFARYFLTGEEYENIFRVVGKNCFDIEL